MRIFLDANVLFSASQPDSTFARLIAIAARQATLLTSDVARAEARRNLILRRPAWVATFETWLRVVESMLSASFELPCELDEKDIPLLCAAIRARADFFVTGDRRNFGHLFEQRVHGVMVITPLRLAELLVVRDDGQDDR